MRKTAILAVMLAGLPLNAFAMNVVATCTPQGGTSVAGGKSTPVTKASLKGTTWTYAWFAGKADAKITLKSAGEQPVAQDANVMASSEEMVTFVVLQKSSFWTHTLFMDKNMMHGSAVFSEHTTDDAGKITSQQVRAICKITM